jgi:hypothetical protein
MTANPPTHPENDENFSEGPGDRRAGAAWGPRPRRAGRPAARAPRPPSTPGDMLAPGDMSPPGYTAPRRAHARRHVTTRRHRRRALSPGDMSPPRDMLAPRDMSPPTDTAARAPAELAPGAGRPKNRARRAPARGDKFPLGRGQISPRQTHAAARFARARENLAASPARPLPMRQF